MVEYRFRLIRDAVITLVDPEPQNFGSVKSVIKRAFKTHGSFYQFTDGDLKLGFTGNARETLRDAFEEDGKDAVVTLVADRRPDEYSDWVNIFTGQANFLTYELNQEYVQIDFENIDLQTKIKSRFDQDYDTSKTTNLEGGVIAPDLSDFNYNPLLIYRQSQMNANFAPIFQVIYNAGLQFDITQSGQNKTNRDEIFYLNGDRATNPNSFSEEEVPFETFNDGTISIDGWNTGTYYEFQSELGIDSYTVDLDMDIRFSVIGSGGGGTLGATSLRTAFLIYIVTADGDEILEEVDLHSNNRINGDPIATFNITKTVTIEKQTKRVYLAWRSSATSETTGSLAFTTDDFENYFTWEAKTISEFPGTVLNGQLIHETIDKNLEYITGEQDLLYSDFLGRTDLGYDVDGAGGLFFETNGFNIRGTTRGIVGNLKDRLSSLNGIFNLGYGIQFKDYDKENYQYRVEPSEYWYQPVEMASFTDIEQQSYNETFFTDLGFNEIQTGFTKYPDDDEDVASLLDWFGPSNYSLPSSKPSPTDDEGNTSKYDIKSDYIASPYLWETVRRQQFTQEPTKGTKYDEDLFIVQLEDDYPNYRQLSRSSSVTITDGGELYNQPSEVRDSYFNFLIRPIYNLINHGFIINGSLFGKNNNSKYRNIFYPNNQELEYSITASTTLGNDKSYVNNDDPLRGDMEDGLALFDPILINFKCALTRSQADEIILGHQNGLNEGNYGYITVIDPDGNTKQGWVLELKFNPVDEIGEFQLIKRSSYGV